MPNYSVIVPVYNREAFIGRAVKSVLAQDCIPDGEIEVIVIDDGSTDGTKGAVEKIIQSNPRQEVVLEAVAHIGEPGTVRNIGLRKARGEFVAYCDSDDFWLPHHLATANQAFKKKPNVGMVANYWALAHFTPTDQGVVTKIIVPQHPKSTVNTNCRVHRKSCAEKIGDFNTTQWGEDQHFFNRIENMFGQYKTGIVTSINGYIKGGNNLTYKFDTTIKGNYF